MRPQPPPQQRTLALPRSGGNASAKYMFTPAGGHSSCVRAAIRHDNWEGDLFVGKVCDARADLSKFLFDNHDASNRTRMFSNRPRTIGTSEQGSF
jgi:hypothetical protein